MADMARLGILISSRGSNMMAIADSIDAGRIPDAKIVIVLTNRADAKGLILAKNRGIPIALIPSKGRSREEHEALVLSTLQALKVDLVCLAGYMRILSPEFVKHYPNRILNIHPSLLPAFPGETAQADALKHGVKVAGCTIHFATEELDNGPIIMQAMVRVIDSDTEKTLAARILKKEHITYTRAINMVLSGHYKVDGRRFVRR